IELGSMEIGDLMAFIQYVMLIMFALMMASMMFVIIPRASVSADRIQEVLELETKDIKQGNTSFSGKQSELQFSDVTFYYPKADEPALSYISFTAESGKLKDIFSG